MFLCLFSVGPPLWIQRCCFPVHCLLLRQEPPIFQYLSAIPVVHSVASTALCPRLSLGRARLFAGVCGGETFCCSSSRPLSQVRYSIRHLGTRAYFCELFRTTPSKVLRFKPLQRTSYERRKARDHLMLIVSMLTVMGVYLQTNLLSNFTKVSN